MLKAIINWFTGSKPDPRAEAPRVAEEAAPYKIETPIVAPMMVPPPAPEPAKCGCGRSTTGYCVGLHKLTAQEWAVHPNNPVKPVIEQTKSKPDRKTVTKDKPAKKPAAIKAAPKKAAPRKPAAK